MSLKKEKTEEIAEVDSSRSGSPDDYLSDSPSPIKRKVKMSDKITLNVLTKFIKPYKGDRESLPAFLTNCENAISLASTDQQNVLCKYIVSQLEGKAQLACCLKRFSEWSEIKQFLKSTFGEKKHSTHLLVDLQNCKQLPSEDVTQYSLRLESCLTRLQSDIHYSCENEQELLGRLAAMEDLALNTFLLGLNSSFSHIVRCRNPKSLSDATTHAFEEEKLYKLSKLNRTNFKTHCTICNKSGHVAAQCFKNKSNSANFHHVNSIHEKKYYNRNPNFDTNKSCAYCKNRGHVIGECRKLKYKNNQARRALYTADTSHNSTLTSASAPTSSHLPSNNRSNVHAFNTSNDCVTNLN